MSGSSSSESGLEVRLHRGRARRAVGYGSSAAVLVGGGILTVVAAVGGDIADTVPAALLGALGVGIVVGLWWYFVAAAD